MSCVYHRELCITESCVSQRAVCHNSSDACASESRVHHVHITESGVHRGELRILLRVVYMTEKRIHRSRCHVQRERTTRAMSRTTLASVVYTTLFGHEWVS